MFKSILIGLCLVLSGFLVCETINANIVGGSYFYIDDYYYVGDQFGTIDIYGSSDLGDGTNIFINITDNDGNDIFVPVIYTIDSDGEGFWETTTIPVIGANFNNGLIINVTYVDFWGNINTVVKSIRSPRDNQ